MLDSAMITMYANEIRNTLIMTLGSTLLGYVLGLPLGILLTVTDKNGIRPNAVIYRVIDVITNILRSIPFLILLVLIMPLTKMLVGRTSGTNASMMVPLIVSGAPYIARMVESSLKEVDHGVIEAAQSMGASTWQIIWKVLLGEARVSLIVNATIVTCTVLGYSAMAGTVGAGGLGKIAMTYGYYRYQTDIMIVAVVILVLLVQIMQLVGMFVSRKLDKRINE